VLISTCHAQIPINGFCRYREYSVGSGFKKIFPADFSMDGYRDLILFTGAESKYSVLTSDSKSNLNKPSERNSGFTITQVHSLGNEVSGRNYLVISRKNRQVALSSFSKSGSLISSGKVKLKGFPANLDIGDVNANGRNEGIVSGPSLNGLYIIEENKRTLTSRPVVEGKVFTASVFVDLDYDNYADVAAFDPILNDLILYENNHRGGYSEARSFHFEEEIKELRAADFNTDNFIDLVFIDKGKLTVMLGDSVSSFRKKIIFDTPVPVSNYAIFDFNGDGYNDVAFINGERGELYISFAKNTKEFYPPILYMKKDSLIDLAAYVDRGGRKLALLSSGGKVFLINSTRIDDNEFSVSLGLKPATVQSFDYLGDSFKDICFVDEADFSLKLLLNERRNFFRTYIRIPIKCGCNQIKVDDSHSKLKTFFLFKNDSRTLEIVRVNLENFTSQNRVVYLDGTTEDLKFTSDRLVDRLTVNVLVKKNNILALQTFDLRDFKVYMSGTEEVAANVSASCISHEVYKDIYYFTNSSDGAVLMKSTFERKIVDRNPVFTLRENLNEDTHYSLISMDQNIDRYKPTLATVSARKANLLYLLYKNKVDKFALKAKVSFSPMLQSSYDEGNNALLIGFKDELGKLHGISLKLSGKSIEEKVLLDIPGFNSYILQNLGGMRRYLIYSDNSKNVLTFEKYK
jgi:hypothetical protein